MNSGEVKQRLSELLTQKRVEHSKRVAECAVKLAKIYNCDEKKAYIAGMVHDAAKCLNLEQVYEYVDKYEIYLDPIEDGNRALSHSVVGASIVRYEFGIEDEDIINSVKYHTTGRAEMSLLEKIIYLADLLEDGRVIPHIEELRELAYSGQLDKAMIESFNQTLTFVIANDNLIHPRSVEARNYLLREIDK
ncbi:MAG: bis(5'-nucleosyl)-tetraphosphatase (symmetrical) YqeK [Clostridioides sp.]|jgi:predicted HD superfamily hydrolase involved in NAD metabolism|nr:bis(5'-nucleosyl)-tetraphosphatase (symmetrical) YqeK [Clostridioides sp.]